MRSRASTSIRPSTDFTKWGKALDGEGLQFHYHVHGYEFAESPDGTLLDTLMKQSPKEVAFQMDVFWVMRGGGDPAELLPKYPGRFLLMHLKDIAQGHAARRSDRRGAGRNQRAARHRAR